MEENTEVESGEAGESTEANGEPTAAEGSFDGMTAEQLHDSYKSLQTELGKRTEALKQFDRFGGAERLLQLAEELDANPKFVEWYKEQQNASVVGDEYSDYDEDTKKALELVQRLSERISDAKVKQYLEAEVGPIKEKIMAQQMEQTIETVSSKLENFDEMRQTMSELAAELPEKIQNNPTAEDLEDLYWKAVRKSGKFEEYAAKAYEKKLQQAKKQSSDTPSQKAEPSKITGKLSMVEAARAAGINI